MYVDPLRGMPWTSPVRATAQVQARPGSLTTFLMNSGASTASTNPHFDPLHQAQNALPKSFIHAFPQFISASGW